MSFDSASTLAGSQQDWIEQDSSESLLFTRPNGDVLAVAPAAKNNTILSLLALVQEYDVDILPYGYQSDYNIVGIGGTSRIQQAYVRQEVGFVYKTMCMRNADGLIDAEATYHAVTSELSILAHPSLRHHHSIVNLEGVCWDVPVGDKHVWPIIILEKAQYGSLYEFMTTERGQQITIQERVDFCVGIASAIHALHTYDFVHGDVKPQNVVVCADPYDYPYVKLADFGFSSAASFAEKDVIKIPKSIPWSAPEYHHRGFSLQKAQATDLYSLGLLCFWLLFYDAPIDRRTKELLSLESSRGNTVGELFRDSPSIENLKTCSGIQKLVRHIFEAHPSNDVMNAGILRFLEALLDLEPENRQLDISCLDAALDIKSILGPTDLNASSGNTKDDEVSLELKIAPMMRHLFRCHLRVRKNIVTSLTNVLEADNDEATKQHAAFQLAICCRIGCGIATDDYAIQRWLKIAGRNQGHLEIQISSVLKNCDLGLGPSFTGNSLDGSLPSNSLSEDYAAETIDLMPALRAEISDVQQVLGKRSECVRTLKSILADTLLEKTRYDEAKEIILETLALYSDEIVSDLDASRPDWWNRELHKKFPPERLQVPTLESLDISPSKPELEAVVGMVNPRSQESLITLRKLMQLYRSQGRRIEAAWLLTWALDFYIKYYGRCSRTTFSCLGQLALLCTDLRRLKDAEHLFAYTMEGYEIVLGPKHPVTLTAYQCLIEIKIRQGKYHEAEELLNKILHNQEKLLHSKSSMLLQSVIALATCFTGRGQFQEAARLLDRCFDVRDTLEINKVIRLNWVMESHATHYNQVGDYKTAEKICDKMLAVCGSSPQVIQHRIYAWIELGESYIFQGRLSEAKQLIMSVPKRSREEFGNDHERTRKAIGLVCEIHHLSGDCQSERELIQGLITEFWSQESPRVERELFLVHNRIRCALRHGRLSEAWTLYRYFAGEFILKDIIKGESPIKTCKSLFEYFHYRIHQLIYRKPPKRS